MAPLAKAAGGYGIGGDVFSNPGDADDQALLKAEYLSEPGQCVETGNEIAGEHRNVRFGLLRCRDHLPVVLQRQIGMNVQVREVGDAKWGAAPLRMRRQEHEGHEVGREDWILRKPACRGGIRR